MCSIVSNIIFNSVFYCQITAYDGEIMFRVAILNYFNLKIIIIFPDSVSSKIHNDIIVSVLFNVHYKSSTPAKLDKDNKIVKYF